MGPPGVGKGTQAKGIADHYRIPAISTGDIFRANVKNKTPLGMEVARIMEIGGYVPDEITDSIVENRLGEADALAGWLLDGYPRTLGQVESLDQVLARTSTAIDAVISLVADQEPLVARLLKRAELEGRADDNEQTITHRMEVYNEATDPLLAIYRDRGLLVEVDGIGGIEEVAERITGALDAKLG
jgi:adenylate kinase